MHGQNPIRRPETGDGSTLGVKEIFATLQGEGPRAGQPAVFIRLGGCNLACAFCDTDFEDYVEMPVAAVAREAVRRKGPATLAVITGGEPFRQPIAPLCELLQKSGFTVQIETNGTLYRPLPEGVEIVCSPKPGAQGYALLRPDLLERLTALKFLISAHDPLYADATDVGQGPDVPVYVQPMDEADPARNAANVERAVALAHTHGYRLSLQLHKIVGIP